MVVVQQRFSVDARTHVVVRQTEKVDFQSTGSEPLALQARVVQFEQKVTKETERHQEDTDCLVLFVSFCTTAGQNPRERRRSPD